jgi:hypothetical protein
MKKNSLGASPAAKPALLASLPEPPCVSAHSGDGQARGWQPIETAPEGEPVLTKIDDKDGERNVQIMVRRGRLWFASPETYVYYSPTHWARP